MRLFLTLGEDKLHFLYNSKFFSQLATNANN